MCTINLCHSIYYCYVNIIVIKLINICQAVVGKLHMGFLTNLTNLLQRTPLDNGIFCLLKVMTMFIYEMRQLTDYAL